MNKGVSAAVRKAVGASGAKLDPTATCGKAGLRTSTVGAAAACNGSVATAVSSLPSFIPLDEPGFPVLLHPDDAKDRVFVAIVKALLRSGNTPMTPNELSKAITQHDLAQLSGGVMSDTSVSNRISQHFKRATRFPGQGPVLGKQFADMHHTRKLRYFVAQEGVPASPLCTTGSESDTELPSEIPSALTAHNTSPTEMTLVTPLPSPLLSPSATVSKLPVLNLHADISEKLGCTLSPVEGSKMSSTYSAGDARFSSVPRSATMTGDDGNEIYCEFLSCSKSRRRRQRSSTVDIMEDDTTDFESLYESLKDHQVPLRSSVRVDEQIPEANNIHKFFVGDESWWEDEKPAMLPEFSQTTRRGSCSAEASELGPDYNKLKHGRFGFFDPIEEQLPFVPGITSLQSWVPQSRPQSTFGSESQPDPDATLPSLLDRSFEEVAPLEKRWLALDEEESSSSSESEPSNAETEDVSASFGKIFQSCNSDDQSLEWSSISEIDSAITFSAAASPIPFDSFDGDDNIESTMPPLSLVDGSKARVKAQTKNQLISPPATINFPSLVLLPPLQPLATISPTVWMTTVEGVPVFISVLYRPTVTDSLQGFRPFETGSNSSDHKPTTIEPVKNLSLPPNSVPILRRMDNNAVNATFLLHAGGILTEKERSIILSLERERIRCGKPQSQLFGTWVPLDRGRGLARSCCLDQLLAQFLSDSLPSTHFGLPIRSIVKGDRTDPFTGAKRGGRTFGGLKMGGGRRSEKVALAPAGRWQDPLASPGILVTMPLMVSIGSTLPITNVDAISAEGIDSSRPLAACLATASATQSATISTVLDYVKNGFLSSTASSTPGILGGLSALPLSTSFPWLGGEPLNLSTPKSLAFPTTASTKATLSNPPPISPKRKSTNKNESLEVNRAKSCDTLESTPAAEESNIVIKEGKPERASDVGISPPPSKKARTRKILVSTSASKSNSVREAKEPQRSSVNSTILAEACIDDSKSSENLSPIEESCINIAYDSDNEPFPLPEVPGLQDRLQGTLDLQQKLEQRDSSVEVDKPTNVNGLNAPIGDESTKGKEVGEGSVRRSGRKRTGAAVEVTARSRVKRARRTLVNAL